MRTFRYFLALFVVVLAVTEVLSLPTPAGPSTPAKKPAAAAASNKGKAKAVASRPVSPANSRPGSPAPPSRPGTPDPAEGGCGKQTTCEKCIAVKGAAGQQVCGFTQAGKCVGVTGAPAGLAKTAAQCKALATANQAESSGDAALLTAAKAEFAKIKPHVFGTEKNLKNTAGRHLASSLLSVPANKNNLEKTRVSNKDTGLSVFKTAGNKVKTTFDDDLGLWTSAQVEAVCVEAIKNVLKIKKATTLAKGNAITSVSVASPRGNLCMSVQGNTSVFPGSIKKTTTAPGQLCTNDSGSTDE